MASGIKAITTLKIASYNIRKSVGLDWRRDAGRITDVLCEIDADVVVLQEADKRTGQREGTLQLERLGAELSYAIADVSVRPLSHGWHGNAILFREKLDLHGCERVDLPAVEPRGAVSAKFTGPDFRVIGTHLALTPGMRTRQIEALKSYAESTDIPTIIAGDFNEWRSVGAISKSFGPKFQTILPGNSFHASRPVACLDRFILHGNIQELHSHVHMSQLATRASDHLPVVTEIQF